jgi:hypothetical protein
VDETVLPMKVLTLGFLMSDQHLLDSSLNETLIVPLNASVPACFIDL